MRSLWTWWLNRKAISRPESLSESPEAVILNFSHHDMCLQLLATAHTAKQNNSISNRSKAIVSYRNSKWRSAPNSNFMQPKHFSDVHHGFSDFSFFSWKFWHATQHMHHTQYSLRLSLLSRLPRIMKNFPNSGWWLAAILILFSRWDICLQLLAISHKAEQNKSDFNISSRSKVIQYPLKLSFGQRTTRIMKNFQIKDDG